MDDLAYASVAGPILDAVAVAKGDRFQVLEDHSSICLIQWLAPATGSVDCVLPAGMILVADHDQMPGAFGFSCIPEAYYAAMELLVPQEVRSEPKFDGYYFVLDEPQMGTWFMKLS